jgi:hypothetical protein
MKRECQECKEAAVKIKLLAFTNTMHCEKCFAQYEYTSFSKWALAFGGAFIPMVAIYAGLFMQSWIVFGFILIVIPFIAEYAFAKYCSLKLVGVKAIRKKLRGNGL